MKTKQLTTGAAGHQADKALAFQNRYSFLRNYKYIDIFCYKAISIDESDRGAFAASELAPCSVPTGRYYCYAEPPR